MASDAVRFEFNNDSLSAMSVFILTLMSSPPVPVSLQVGGDGQRPKNFKENTTHGNRHGRDSLDNIIRKICVKYCEINGGVLCG
jgi:hypothetical protein